MPVDLENIYVEKLYDEPTVLVGSAENNKPIQQNLPIILFPQNTGPNLYNLIYNVLEKHLNSFSIIHKSKGSASRLTMVEAGIGYTVVPRSMIENESKFTIIDIPDLPSLETGLVYLNRSHSSDIESFVQQIKKHYNV